MAGLQHDSARAARTGDPRALARTLHRGVPVMPVAPRSLRFSALLRLLVCALCALPFAEARAADTVTQPYDGVRHIVRTTNTPNRIQILEVDLTHPKVRLRATRSAHRRSTTSAFADRYGCQMAVNGDFFSFTTYATSGLALGAGEQWSDTSDGSGQGYIAFGRDNAVAISAPSAVAPAEDWMSDVVGGRPLLVKGGERIVFDPCTGFCARNPRTAAGISQDGTTLYLVVVDGRSTTSAGMTLNELGALMVNIGAHRAINLDGGGSSTMFVKNEGGVVNRPSDGSQRTVANHLGVCIVPPHGTLRGYVRQDDIYDDTAGLAGVTVSLSTGQSAVTGADGSYEITEVPRGDVVITADTDEHLLVERSVYVTAADVTWGSVALVEGEDETAPEPDAGAPGGEPDEEPDGAAEADMAGGCALGGRGAGGAAALLLAAALAMAIRRGAGRGRPRRGRAAGPAATDRAPRP